MYHIAVSSVLCSRSFVLYFMTLFIVQDCNRCAAEAPPSWMAAVHQTLRKYSGNIAVDTAVRTISHHWLKTGKEVGTYHSNNYQIKPCFWVPQKKGLIHTQVIVLLCARHICTLKFPKNFKRRTFYYETAEAFVSNLRKDLNQTTLMQTTGYVSSQYLNITQISRHNTIVARNIAQS